MAERNRKNQDQKVIVTVELGNGSGYQSISYQSIFSISWQICLKQSCHDFVTKLFMLFVCGWSLFSTFVENNSFVGDHFYRTQVNLGSDSWIRMSLSE